MPDPRLQNYIPIPICGCHIWLGSLTVYGHGKMAKNGKTVYPHREVYRECVGDPGNRRVLQCCKIQSCINPDHLYLENCPVKMTMGGNPYGRRYEVDDLRVALEAGEKPKDLAIKYNMTLSSLMQAIYRLRKLSQLPQVGRQEHKNKIVLSKEQLTELDNKRGASVCFARKYGLHISTVSKLRKRNNLKRGWTPIDWFNYDAEICRKRTELKISGRQIALAMGISVTSVQKRLRLYGLNGRLPSLAKMTKATKSKKSAKVKVVEQLPTLFYPDGSEGHELWNKAASIVAKQGFNDVQIRKDLTQELCVAVLLGDITEAAMATWVKKANKTAWWSAHDPRNLSLDAPIGEGNSTLYDIVDSSMVAAE